MQGFTPKGFSVDSNDDKFKIISNWSKYFKPYFINYFKKGGSGADISYLKNEENVLVGFRPDSQRYFDYHNEFSILWNPSLYDFEDFHHYNIEVA